MTQHWRRQGIFRVSRSLRREMYDECDSGRVWESLADAVHPVDQPVHGQDARQPWGGHPEHPAQQEDGHEGVLWDAGGAVDKDREDQDGHPDLLQTHLDTFKSCHIEETDDRITGQVDQHRDGEDEAGHLLIELVLAGQALEGDGEGGDGGGGAEVDEQRLGHVHVEPEWVGAGHQQEGDWQEQHEDDFTWY